MKSEILQALKESIAHWERLASGKRLNKEEPNAKYCALCGLYNQPVMPHDERCEGCPVFEHTGEQFCDGTPYAGVERMMIADDFSLDSNQFKKAALKELNFLKSLLPTENNDPRRETTEETTR